MTIKAYRATGEHCSVADIEMNPVDEIDQEFRCRVKDDAMYGSRSTTLR